MPIWTTNPEGAGQKTNYRILRCPTGRPITGVVLDDEFVGTNLHYWKGRSKPCEGATCEACEAGHRPRWKGYVHLYSPQTKTIVIFEFTERVVHEFRAFQTRFGSLRGACITARRLNSKVNGPLLLEFAEGRQDGALLPQVTDLREILCRIWEVKQHRLGFMSADEDLSEEAERGIA